jgi:hypothetical protein
MMSYEPKDYWAECVVSAADEIELELTVSQVDHLAQAIAGGHENYGMAFYSPPASDRLNEIEREWKAKYARLEKEHEAFKRDAHSAVKRALRTYSDAQVSIGPGGDVFTHGGRTEQIQ